MGWGAAAHRYDRTGAGAPKPRRGPEKSTLTATAARRHTERRRGLVFDLQRYLAKTNWGMQHAGAATGFTMAWPALGNFRVWTTTGGWAYYKLWLDDSKAPLKNG